jgi:mitochondrial division protein 1
MQTLHSHSTPITALDFSEPYGTLVSASQEDAQPRVWDLFSASEVGRLKGHIGAVKCVQVEDHVCLTGGEDGNVRLWDLRKVEEESAVTEEGRADDEGMAELPNGIRSAKEGDEERESPCARVLEGHTKAVTALYFEDDCLVSHPLIHLRTDVD